MSLMKEHNFTIEDYRASFDFQEHDSTAIRYRPYQKRAIEKLILSGEEGLLIAPAGSGKTVLGLSLIPMLGQPTLWLTHTKALAYQAIDRIAQFLPSIDTKEIGFLGDTKWNLGKTVTIGLIPTLVRREEELIKLRDNFGLVILDEAHHCPASTFLKVITFLNPYYLYGLTATPYRRDKLEEVMFHTLGPELVRINVDEVEKDGGVIMPKVKYRAIRSAHDSSNNIQVILKKLVANEKRNSIIVGDILREAAEGNFCIVLSDRKVHAEKLYELISLAWPKTGIATGDYSRKYVEEQSNLLNRKEITVLVCTFSLLGEGFDVPFLNRAFITLPFRAEAKAEQLIGRIQRTAEGKKDSIVYDYVDADIGVLYHQFFSRGKKDCRYAVYERLGLIVEPM